MTRPEQYAAPHAGPLQPATDQQQQQQRTDTLAPAASTQVDSDAELARQLQAEEDRRARTQSGAAPGGAHAAHVATRGSRATAAHPAADHAHRHRDEQQRRAEKRDKGNCVVS